MSKNKPNKSNSRLRSGIVTGLIILGIVAVIIVLQLQGNTTSRSGTPQTALDPQIVLNLTQIPDAAPLSGEAAEPIHQLKTMVDACPDYSPERRSQMEQHIIWLLNPALIPAEIIIALGANPSGKLVYGMATYTSIQWQLDDQPGDSCLLPIGETLNEMLIAEGEAPFPVFSEPQ